MAGYSSVQLKDIDSSLSVAVSRKEDMTQLLQRVNDMGRWKRFCDSKVPDRKRGFFRWFSLKVSDPEAMRKEIAKHKTFYSDMEKAIIKARNGAEDADEALQEVYQNLWEMYEEDEARIPGDDSKVVYNMHQDFVADRGRMESCIRRVECVNVRRQLQRTREDLKKAVGAVNDLTKQMRLEREDRRNLEHRFEKLMTVNEELVSHQKQLSQENALIRALLEQLIAAMAGH